MEGDNGERQGRGMMLQAGGCRGRSEAESGDAELGGKEEEGLRRGRSGEGADIAKCRSIGGIH